MRASHYHIQVNDHTVTANRGRQSWDPFSPTPPAHLPHTPWGKHRPTGGRRGLQRERVRTVGPLVLQLLLLVIRLWWQGPLFLWGLEEASLKQSGSDTAFSLVLRHLIQQTCSHHQRGDNKDLPFPSYLPKILIFTHPKWVLAGGCGSSSWYIPGWSRTFQLLCAYSVLCFLPWPHQFPSQVGPLPYF